MSEIRAQLLADLSPIKDIADRLAAVRSRRELAQEGVTSSGIEDIVHGAGCRMIAPDGREADADLVSYPAFGREVEAFDVWRIRGFLDEADDDGYSHSEIQAACTELVAEGRLREVVERPWFSLADDLNG